MAYLSQRYRIDTDHVSTHAHLAATPTVCPGKFFPATILAGASRSTRDAADASLDRIQASMNLAIFTSFRLFLSRSSDFLAPWPLLARSAPFQPSHGLVQQGDHAHRIGDLAAPEHRPGFVPFDAADVDPLAALGLAGAFGQLGRPEQVGDLVADRVGQVRRGDELEPAGDEPGLLAELAERRRLGSLGLGASAFGDLPRVGVERVAVLADEPDAARARRRAGRRRRGS